MLQINENGEIEETEEDDFESRLIVLNQMVKNKQNKEQQRDNLLRYIAALLKIDGTQFNEFS